MGFGSVLENEFIGGHLETISTQAVFDLIKHVKLPEPNGASFVEIGSGEIEEFHIRRNETIVPDVSNTHGKFQIDINKENGRFIVFSFLFFFTVIMQRRLMIYK